MTSTQKSTGTSGVAHASSTGAPGMPGIRDDRSQYKKGVTGYNPSTGSGYDTTASTGVRYHPPHSSSKANDNLDYRAEFAPSTTQKEGHGESETPGGSKTGSKMVEKGEDVSRQARSFFTGIHGAGEYIRGTVNAAVDTAFGHEEGVSKNEAIARKGEQDEELTNQRGS